MKKTYFRTIQNYNYPITFQHLNDWKYFLYLQVFQYYKIYFQKKLCKLLRFNTRNHLYINLLYYLTLNMTLHPFRQKYHKTNCLCNFPLLNWQSNRIIYIYFRCTVCSIYCSSIYLPLIKFIVCHQPIYQD